MPNIVPVQLDTISESQAGKAAAANAIFDALSSAALFGVKSLSGLSLALYGGNMIVAGVPTAVATQTITLTDNATNYIYSTDAGVFTKVTSPPTGWPAISSPANAIALYRLVAAGGLVDDEDFDVYVPSLGIPGIAGIQGIQGPPGVNLAAQRIRWAIWTGNSATGSSLIGMTALTATGVTVTARALATTPFRLTIPYAAYVTAATANSSGYVSNDRTLFFRGNGAGRGGFTLSMRFCLETALSPATFRSFFGAYSATTIGNVEPDTLFNIVGVGSKSGDANLSMIHNDASGTATMVPLGASFPARSTDNVYELTLTCAANGSTIDYSLLDCETGNVASGTLSTNLPDSATFLTWIAYCANVGTASAAAFGAMQTVVTGRW